MYEAFNNSITQPGSSRNAKVYLQKLCSAQQWKQPVFECCKEEGPAHLKRYTFKVYVCSEGGSMIVECFGNPQTSKRVAAEDAAQGALWYFKNIGTSS